MTLGGLRRNTPTNEPEIDLLVIRPDETREISTVVALLRNLSDNGIVGTWAAKRAVFKLARRYGMSRGQATQMWDDSDSDADPLDALLPGEMSKPGLRLLRQKLAK